MRTSSSHGDKGEGGHAAQQWRSRGCDKVWQRNGQRLSQELRCRCRAELGEAALRCLSRISRHPGVAGHNLTGAWLRCPP